MNSSINIGDYFWASAGSLATIIAIVEWIRSHRNEGWKSYGYPILLVLLTAVSTYQIVENHRAKQIESDARALLKSWPPISDLKFRTKGERIGIALAGLAFLEKHKGDLPETYEASKRLVGLRGKQFQPPADHSASLSEYDLLEDLAGATIQLIRSIANVPSD